MRPKTISAYSFWHILNHFNCRQISKNSYQKTSVDTQRFSPIKICMWKQNGGMTIVTPCETEVKVKWHVSNSHVPSKKYLPIKCSVSRYYSCWEIGEKIISPNVNFYMKFLAQMIPWSHLLFGPNVICPLGLINQSISLSYVLIILHEKLFQHEIEIYAHL